MIGFFKKLRQKRLQKQSRFRVWFAWYPVENLRGGIEFLTFVAIKRTYWDENKGEYVKDKYPPVHNIDLILNK